MQKKLLSKIDEESFKEICDILGGTLIETSYGPICAKTLKTDEGAIRFEISLNKAKRCRLRGKATLNIGLHSFLQDEKLLGNLGLSAHEFFGVGVPKRVELKKDFGTAILEIKTEDNFVVVLKSEVFSDAERLEFQVYHEGARVWDGAFIIKRVN